MSIQSSILGKGYESMTVTGFTLRKPLMNHDNLSGFPSSGPELQTLVLGVAKPCCSRYRCYADVMLRPFNFGVESRNCRPIDLHLPP